MTTEKKSKSNRANAKLSTGPTTEEGKSAVATNGIVHGLRSAMPVLTSLGENQEAWERHRELIVADLAPEGALETAFAERIALNFWKLGRCTVVEQRTLEATIESLRSSAISNDLLWRDYREGNESGEEALERCIRRRDRQRGLADLWKAIESGADDLPVDPDTAEALRDSFVEKSTWARLKEAFDAEFSWPPEKVADLRSMLDWIYEKCSVEAEPTIKENRIEAEDEAGKLAKAIKMIERGGELAAETAIVDSDVLVKLNRYETSVARALQRDLHDLQRLQAKRQGNPVIAPIAIDVNAEG